MDALEQTSLFDSFCSSCCNRFSFWFLGGFSLVRLAGFWGFRRGFLIQGNLPNPSTEQWNHGWEWYLHGWRRRAHGKAPSHVTEAGNKGLNQRSIEGVFCRNLSVGFFLNTFRSGQNQYHLGVAPSQDASGK